MELIKLKSNININPSENNINGMGQGILKLEGTSDHSKLENLDYENSGHTGFQSEIEDLVEIRSGAEAGATAVQDDNYVHTDNNYSNEEKEKLAGLENYDDTEIKEDISNLETNKADRDEIPDVSGFITNAVNNLLNYYLKSETYTKTEVNNLIGQIETAHFEIVQILPVIGQNNVIYLVPKEGTTGDIYNEYIWINSNWELIGSTEVDLQGYAKETWVNQQIANFLTQSQIETLINTALIGYATESWVNNQGFIKQHQDISGKEDKSNKVTTIDENSTDTQYPSAKAVYNNLSKVSESKVILKENSTGLTPLSEFDVGDSIFINEITKGYTEYIIVEKNDIYEYVTLLRKNCISSMAMSEANSAIPYSQTLVDNYLNTTYKQEINSLNNYLYPIEKRVCYSKAYTRQYETFERSIYAPSAINMAISGNEDRDTQAVDWTIGLKLYYETEDLNTSRKAKDNMGDTYVEYWTASAGAYGASKSSLYTITTSGSSSTRNLTVVEYIRPAITINYNNLMLDDNRRIIIGVPYEPNPVDTVQDGNKYYKIKDTIHTYNNKHNIREINNDVQVFTDNGDVINDNEMFLKNIPVTGTWVFLKDNYENILGYSNGSNIILISKNGGLDFETITMPTIIKSGCYDTTNKTYKLLGVQKVFESSDLKNWTPYNTDSTDWDYIGVKVKFTGTTFLSSNNDRRWKECSTSSYAGNYRTYTKTPKSIARINNTSIMMIVNTDNTQMYTTSIDTSDLPVQLNANINKIINLNDVVFALCSNSNKLYEYVMSSITVTSNDYWQEYTLPITCTVEDITYNSLDGYYYIVNDSNNYLKTKDFENFETVNENTTRGKYCLRTNEGLIISPNNSNQLLIVPAREKLENRLQQLKMELDKTRWVGDGLELVGEQIQVKGSYNIQVTSSGIYVSDSLDLFNFTQDIRTLMRTRLADVLDYPIEGTQEYLDEWIWSEEVLWEKLFDGAVKAIQVRWSVGGTFYEPYGYMEEYTVEKYERGCFYVDQDDTNLKYMKIGVEPPIE